MSFVCRKISLLHCGIGIENDIIQNDDFQETRQLTMVPENTHFTLFQVPLESGVSVSLRRLFNAKRKDYDRQDSRNQWSSCFGQSQIIKSTQ